MRATVGGKDIAAKARGIGRLSPTRGSCQSLAGDRLASPRSMPPGCSPSPHPRTNRASTCAFACLIAQSPPRSRRNHCAERRHRSAAPSARPMRRTLLVCGRFSCQPVTTMRLWSVLSVRLTKLRAWLVQKSGADVRSASVAAGRLLQAKSGFATDHRMLPFRLRSQLSVVADTRLGASASRARVVHPRRHRCQDR
jgi:hypothetical protein